MKKIFFIYSLLFTTTGKAQYESFIQDSAVWIIKEDDLSTAWIENYYGYYMYGDTVILSNQYKKISKVFFKPDLPNWSSPLQVDSLKVVGFIREDGKTVYAIQKNSNGNLCPVDLEFVLFDFNYNISDEVSLCIHVENPDTITSFGTSFLNRKTYNTKLGFQYIEGIGSTNGLFENVFTNLSGGYTYSLSNYCVGTLNECGIVSSISTLNTLPEIGVFPNPSLQNINITLHSGVEKYLITLYSLDGKKILEKEIFTSGSYNIGADPGTYILAISDEQGRSFYQLQKIINY